MKKSTLGIIIGLVALLAIGAVVFFFTYGGKDLSKYVPTKSIFVAKLSLQKIGSKIDFEYVKRSDMYNEMLESFSVSDRKMLENLISTPTNSGINPLADPYVFAYNASRKGDDPEIFMGLVFQLTDPDDLIKNMEKISDKDIKQHKANDFEWVKLNSDAIIAWKEKVAILIAGDVSDEDDFVKEAKQLFGLEKEESMLSNSSYTSFQKNASDFNFFINKPVLEKLLDLYIEEQYNEYDNSWDKEVLNQLKSGFPSWPIGMTLQFETDQILLKSFGDSDGKEADNLLKNTGLSDKDLSMISSDGKPLMLMTLNINMPAYFKLLRKQGEIDRELDQICEGIGITKNQLETLLKGNLSIALAGFTSPDGMEEEVSEPKPILTLHVGLSNGSTFDNIMDNVGSSLERDGDMWVIPSNGLDLEPLGYILHKNKELVFSNDKEGMRMMNEGSGWKDLSDDAGREKAKNNAFSIHVDLRYERYAPFLEQIFSPHEETEAEITKKVLKDMKSIEMSGNTTSSELLINFNPTQTNSLMHILKLVEASQ